MKRGAIALLLTMGLPAFAEYHFELQGPEDVTAGFDMYVQFRAVFSGEASRLFLNDVKAPAGLKVELICNIFMPDCYKDKQKRTFQYNGQDPVLVHVSAAKSMAPGNYTAAIVTEAGGETHDVHIPVRVTAAPAPPRKPAIGEPAPIPTLQKWKTTMLALARQWCDPGKPNAQYFFGVESQAWYYDGARVYFQIADYTQDRSWEACAMNVARQYRDYVISNEGKLPGYRVFTRGLRMAYERTHDESYKTAVMMLTKSSAYAPLGGHISDEYIRETAYAVEAYITAEKLGAPRNPFLARAVDHLLGDYDMLFTTGKYHFNQPFMDGLAAEALIEYFELTGDPRVLPAVKTMCDWVWNNAWKKNQLAYNAEPAGPHCTDGCQHYATDLINLVAPAYAWVWAQTGDETYLHEGDELFSHALDSDIDYSGKIFSQNYRWSFDYVAWRSAKRPAH